MRSVEEEYAQWDPINCPCKCRGQFIMHERRRLRALTDKEYMPFILKIDKQIEEIKKKKAAQSQG